ncbi:GNAT family N-acetyltransferase [Actinoplanes sp. NPDC049265]|uniref:GNAT family N-acetyltransferase n=1 Tax=Actinoplanes sp. NPDC049265 TaxID=3363902 RepID=UPI0037213D69
MTLKNVIARLEAGDRLSGDPWLELVPAPAPGHAAVLSLPGHVVVAADVGRGWLDSWMRGDFADPLRPAFLDALEEQLRGEAGNLDALLMAGPLPGPPEIALASADDSIHDRVARAHRYRADVRAWASSDGIVILGRGVAGRWETAFEVDPAAWGSGHGRALARAARHLVPDGRPVWAQCSPGNASSLRALLAAGFVPIGSELLISPPRAL